MEDIFHIYTYYQKTKINKQNIKEIQIIKYHHYNSYTDVNKLDFSFFGSCLCPVKK